MTQAKWLLEVAESARKAHRVAYLAAHRGEQFAVLAANEAAMRATVAAVLLELSQRPEDWCRYELADLADEIKGEDR